LSAYKYMCRYAFAVGTRKHKQTRKNPEARNDRW